MVSGGLLLFCFRENLPVLFGMMNIPTPLNETLNLSYKI